MSDNQLTWLIKQYPGLIYHLFEDALFDKSLEECDDDVKWHKLFLSCLVDTRELPAYRIGLARLLVLTDKIDINQPNVDGDTPFLSACVRMPRLALALIPLINTLTSQVNHNGKTALMCAAQSGDADLLQALIAKGASSNTKDVKGHDALNYAILNDRIEVVRLLLPTNDSLDVLKDACKNIYNEEMITCIYQHFAASGNEMKRAAGEMILQVACSINSKLINFIINITD